MPDKDPLKDFCRDLASIMLQHDAAICDTDKDEIGVSHTYITFKGHKCDIKNAWEIFDYAVLLKDEILTAKTGGSPDKNSDSDSDL